jgi:hypothetical protein
MIYQGFSFRFPSVVFVLSVANPNLRSSKKTKLELSWIGKEHRPRLEPRILLEEPG